VEELNGEVARRAGRYVEAAEYQAAALPAATRLAGGTEVVRILHKALANHSERRAAISSLDALNNQGAAAGMDSFATLMFSMNWYTMLGDVDRASGEFSMAGRIAAHGSHGHPFQLGILAAGDAAVSRRRTLSGVDPAHGPDRVLAEVWSAGRLPAPGRHTVVSLATLWPSS